MSDIRRIGPIGLVNENAVFIKLLDGSDLKLTCIDGPYAVAVYDAIATALRTARNEALEEAADACWQVEQQEASQGSCTSVAALDRSVGASRCARAIRALKHKDGQP